MKWLLILVILLIAAALIFVRFRREIMTALHVWRMFKKMREMNRPPEKKIESSKTNGKEIPLVRCERCGNWTPQNQALNLRSKTFYCSAKCMERAVKLQAMVD